MKVPFRMLLLTLASLSWLLSSAHGQVASNGARQEKFDDVDKAVLEAFPETHQGWSSDELIIRESLNREFIKRVRERLPKRGGQSHYTDYQINWRLVSLRKAGKLKTRSTRRSKVDVEGFRLVAEMAMRTMLDKHKVSTDRILCDPKLRSEFDQLAKDINSDAKPYEVRKAVLQIRKTRKLKPELIGRIADWGRKVDIVSISKMRESPEEIPAKPGVYIFRDRDGYVYIGQAANLRERLQQHLSESHNQSLATYLQANNQPIVEVHSFDPESRAKEVRVRRAYESALIASRKPRFNIQP